MRHLLQTPVPAQHCAGAVARLPPTAVADPRWRSPAALPAGLPTVSLKAAAHLKMVQGQDGFWVNTTRGQWAAENQAL